MDKSREGGLCFKSRVTITNFELASQHVGFFGMSDNMGKLVGTRNKVYKITSESLAQVVLE